MRPDVCQQEKRMLRALHSRWPYRRSHCRHDLHWLVRVDSKRSDCKSARAHLKATLSPVARRPRET